MIATTHLGRTLHHLLSRLFEDRRGSGDLSTYLLLTAAGCVMVGLTAPALFASSRRASETFEQQVGVLERGASPYSSGSDGDWNISIGPNGVQASSGGVSASLGSNGFEASAHTSNSITVSGATTAGGAPAEQPVSSGTRGANGGTGASPPPSNNAQKLLEALHL